MKTNIYDKITEKIIAQPENGIVPWHKPWMGATGCGCVSHTTGRPYSLLNQMLLEHRAGEYLTYGQIQAEGGRIKKGEQAQMVVFWSFVQKVIDTKVIEEKDGNGDVVGTETRETIKTTPILKAYQVWHIEQTEGIKPKWNNEVRKFEHEPIEEAEVVAACYIGREGIKLEIENDDRACYSPILDRVRVPQMQQYPVREEYYSTLFHELTHSTGHEKRLNREGIAGVHFFGDAGYSKEELIAEMGSAFVLQLLGIDCEKAFKNSVAYIQSWLRALKNDKRMIVSAAAKAEQAAKMIMNIQ